MKGKATLKPESAAQLANVAAIMKAYPAVNIKIGGYTDNKGNAKANVKLSADRAKNVMGELVCKMQKKIWLFDNFSGVKNNQDCSG